MSRTLKEEVFKYTLLLLTTQSIRSEKEFIQNYLEEFDLNFETLSTVRAEDTQTGDIAMYENNTYGIILGQFNKELCYFSPMEKKVVSNEFSNEIGNLKLIKCFKRN